MNYVYRNTSNKSWTFRILHGSPDGFHKTFSDSVYGGKRKSKKAADSFSLAKLNSLPKRIKIRLVCFGYTFKTKEVVRKRHRLINGKRTHVGFIAKYCDRSKQTQPQKEFNFGLCRTKRVAYRLAKQWWVEQTKGLTR